MCIGECDVWYRKDWEGDEKGTEENDKGRSTESRRDRAAHYIVVFLRLKQKPASFRHVKQQKQTGMIFYKIDGTSEARANVITIIFLVFTWNISDNGK